MRLSDNMVLARHRSDAAAFLGGGSLGLVRREAVAEATERVVKAMDVRKSGADPQASALSGGNLQKFIVGREISQQPKVLIAAQPTWGVDVGASAQIRQALIDLRDQGVAVLVVSEELDELMEISDRLAVIAQGRLSEPKPVHATSAEEIGLLMAGAHRTQGAGVPAAVPG